MENPAVGSDLLRTRPRRMERCGGGGDGERERERRLKRRLRRDSLNWSCYINIVCAVNNVLGLCLFSICVLAFQIEREVVSLYCVCVFVSKGCCCLSLSCRRVKGM